MFSPKYQNSRYTNVEFSPTNHNSRYTSIEFRPKYIKNIKLADTKYRFFFKI